MNAESRCVGSSACVIISAALLLICRAKQVQAREAVVKTCMQSVFTAGLNHNPSSNINSGFLQ